MNACGMIIRHFPYRSVRQYERKIANGGAAYARNVALPRAIGDGWREMYDRLRAGVLPSWYASFLTPTIPNSTNGSIVERWLRIHVSPTTSERR